MTAANARRWAISSQVGREPRLRPASRVSTPRRTCRSGGMTAAWTALLSTTSAMMSAARSPTVTGSSSAMRLASRERKEKVYERLATYPARWAASCTESLKRRVLFSLRAGSSSPPVNSCVMAAEARAARPVPR